MSFRRFVKAFIPRALFRLVEPWGHLGEAVLLNTLYGFPWRGLKVIGVTGTNGKSTTCFLIHKMLTEAGYKAALMTTIAYGVGNNIKPQDEHMTTSSVPKMLKRLKQLKRDHDFDWVILEVTSQGLAQHRVWGVPFHLAVMTNVTHEHLDYHGTFENYRDAKRKLFKMAKRNRRGTQIGVINADDPSAALFEKDVLAASTYGVKRGFLRAKNIKMTAAGSQYTAQFGEGDKLAIKCHLPGSFNVYNSLAAVAAGRLLHLSNKQIEQGIAALKSVEGRMTSIDEGQPFGVIVDYAHTPDSFEKLLSEMRKTVDGQSVGMDAAQGSGEERAKRRLATESERQSVTDKAMRHEPAGVGGSAVKQGKAANRLIVMFGSAGGQRDPAKRPIQGEIAGKYADEIVLTEEDDRDTPGAQILEEIAAGAEKAGKVRDKNLFLVHNRAEAIKFTLGRAKAGDTVLLLGKGHEKTIERADGEHPWDEVATAKKALGG